MSVNVGLLTALDDTPSPSASPRTNTVLPAPRSPESSTTEPAASLRAKSRPTPAVSSSECVVMRLATMSSGRADVVRLMPDTTHGHEPYVVSAFRWAFDVSALGGPFPALDNLSPCRELEDRIADVACEVGRRHR